MPLNRDALLSKRPKPPTLIKLPDGDEFFVRGMTAGERDSWEAGNLAFRNNQEGEPSATPLLVSVRSRMVVRGLCDENGVRQFADEEFTLISNLDCALVAKAYEVIQNLSGISKGDLDEILKN